MWVLQPRRALWHCHTDAGADIALCGAEVPAPGKGREQENRPAGFDGLLCNKCWFASELIDTLAVVTDSNTRSWLETLNYSNLTDSETEKLCEELGENRALSLVVIHGLAESSEADYAPKPVSLAPQPQHPESATLAVIPLIFREPTQVESPEEPDEETAKPESEAPKMKINCTKISSTAPSGGGGLNRFLKRLGRSQE